jgi:hypothetical protein
MIKKILIQIAASLRKLNAESVRVEIKKRTLVRIAGAIIAILIIFLLYNRTTNINPLKDEDILNIRKIEIVNQWEGYSVTKQEDINVLFKILKSMKLDKNEYSNLDGTDYMFFIEPQDGRPYTIGIYSDNVRIRNQYYKLNKDYYDNITKVFDELSDKYPKIELN